MSAPALSLDTDQIAEHNAWLETQTAEQRVAWALKHGPAEAAMSSSFGAQAAVLLHMVTRQKPDIPVVLIDTGYLFPETYRFADELTERLKLNLQVFRPLVSRAWMEARHGRLWEQGLVGIEQYNSLRKVEPMKRALKELGVGTWFTGLRRTQPGERPGTAAARGPLEGQSHRRLDRPRRLAVHEAARPALPPAVGAGLRVDRRFPHHAPLGARHARGGHPFQRPQARVRHPRGSLMARPGG